jgi:hypothetical protein
MLFPLLAKTTQGELGFWLQMLITFSIGVFNTVIQSSAVAFASIFPLDQYIGLYFTGTGIAGLSIALLKTLLILAFPREDKYLFIITVIYVFVSAVFLYLIIYYYLTFRRTAYCR